MRINLNYPQTGIVVDAIEVQDNYIIYSASKKFLEGSIFLLSYALN